VSFLFSLKAEAKRHNAMLAHVRTSAFVAHAVPHSVARTRTVPAAVVDRRGVLFGAALVALTSSAPARASAPAEGLRPLDEYLARLDGCIQQLETLATGFESGDAFTPKDYALARQSLHVDELGRFWVTARGCDKYLYGNARSPFAREKEDMWKLIPEKSGLGANLVPNFDNADDKLCLIYSCVNDPTAPASIDTLYALKLFDEGLRIGSKGDKVTPEGLGFVARDVLEKLVTYRQLVADKADASMVDTTWANPASTSWGGVGI
jgi:hypothetical protein